MAAIGSSTSSQSNEMSPGLHPNPALGIGDQFKGFANRLAFVVWGFRSGREDLLEAINSISNSKDPIKLEKAFSVCEKRIHDFRNMQQGQRDSANDNEGGLSIFRGTVRHFNSPLGEGPQIVQSLRTFIFAEPSSPELSARAFEMLAQPELVKVSDLNVNVLILAAKRLMFSSTPEEQCACANFLKAFSMRRQGDKFFPSEQLIADNLSKILITSDDFHTQQVMSVISTLSKNGHLSPQVATRMLAQGVILADLSLPDSVKPSQGSSPQSSYSARAAELLISLSQDNHPSVPREIAEKLLKNPNLLSPEDQVNVLKSALEKGQGKWKTFPNDYIENCLTPMLEIDESSKFGRDNFFPVKLSDFIHAYLRDERNTGGFIRVDDSGLLELLPKIGYLTYSDESAGTEWNPLSEGPQVASNSPYASQVKEAGVDLHANISDRFSPATTKKLFLSGEARNEFLLTVGSLIHPLSHSALPSVPYLIDGFSPKDAYQRFIEGIRSLGPRI